LRQSEQIIAKQKCGDLFGVIGTLSVGFRDAANDVEYSLRTITLAVISTPFLNRTTVAITAKRARSSSLSN
jgi:hypothetical protein